MRSSGRGVAVDCKEVDMDILATIGEWVKVRTVGEQRRSRVLCRWLQDWRLGTMLRCTMASERRKCRVRRGVSERVGNEN